MKPGGLSCNTRPSLGLSISALQATSVCFYVIQYVKEPCDSVSSKVTQSLFIIRSGFHQGLYDSTISGGDVQVLTLLYFAKIYTVIIEHRFVAEDGFEPPLT